MQFATFDPNADILKFPKYLFLHTWILLPLEPNKNQQDKKLLSIFREDLGNFLWKTTFSTWGLTWGWLKDLELRMVHCNGRYKGQNLERRLASMNVLTGEALSLSKACHLWLPWTHASVLSGCIKAVVNFRTCSHLFLFRNKSTSQKNRFAPFSERKI